MTEDEMVGWHHWPNGHEFEQTPDDSEWQGSLECYGSCVTKCWTWLSDWTTTITIWKGISTFNEYYLPMDA